MDFSPKKSPKGVLSNVNASSFSTRKLRVFVELVQKPIKQIDNSALLRGEISESYRVWAKKASWISRLELHPMESIDWKIETQTEDTLKRSSLGPIFIGSKN